MVSSMIKIDTNDREKWKQIEKKHNKWFKKEFNKKWEEHTSTYNELSSGEKKFLKESAERFSEIQDFTLTN